MNEKILDEEHLKTSEMAALAKVSIPTINEWRRILDKPRKETKESKYFIPGGREGKTDVEKVDDPEIWKNKEWFEDQYHNKGLGIRLIARKIGISYYATYRYFKKFNIERRSLYEARKSKNKCCTPEWVEEHYIIQNLSLRECARLAGVNRYTFYDWIIKFGFEYKDLYYYRGEKSKNYGVLGKKKTNKKKNGSPTK